MVDALLLLGVKQARRLRLGVVGKARGVRRAQAALLLERLLAAVLQDDDALLQLAHLVVVRSALLLERLVARSLGLLRLLELLLADGQLERDVLELLGEHGVLALQLPDHRVLCVHLGAHARGRRLVLRLLAPQFGLERAALLGHRTRDLLLALAALDGDLLRLLPRALHVDERELLAHPRELTLLALLG